MLSNGRPFYHQMLVSPHIGGAAKLAIESHKYTVACRGPISQLLLPRGGEAEKAARDSGLPFLDYNLDGLVKSHRLTSLTANLDLYLRMAKYRRGIIHIHSPFVYGAAAPFLRISQLKKVLHIHLDFSEDQLRWPLRFPPDIIFVCADFIRPAVEETLSRTGTNLPKIRVLLNAVDTDRFYPAERSAAKIRLGVCPEVPLIVMVANLAPHKGQDTAIRAVASLKSRGREVKLWLVGAERESSAAYRDYLNNMAVHLRIEQFVDFVGFRNDIPDILRGADFLLLPSTREGLPLVILEAQASKVVVLAAPTAGVPEIIDNGRTGYLVDFDDHVAYAERISFLLTNRSRMEAIQDSAYKQIQDSGSIKQYGSKVLREYDSILRP
jgi:glycosyltransferase involved in cell wall biosynthesis